jgi:type I restriction enzyme S subunit
MVLFRVNPEILNSQFGLYSIYGGVAAEFIRQLSLGSTVSHFNMFDIACIPMLLPPIGEQQTIANFLNLESKKLAEAIDRAHREISLLREYRIRLIADVVTGKLDVREAAANLPDEIDKTEVLEEELSENEEITEEGLQSELEGIEA